MSTAVGTPPVILPYDPDLFVNREPEIELVERRAQALSRGESVPNRTVIFWGYRGSGRTWLLKRLQEKLSNVNGIQARYLDLDEWPDRSDMGSSRQRPASLDDEISQMLLDVQALLADQVVVLLLDHVYEQDVSLLALLEDKFLALLVVHPHLLLVMAGRGQAYKWKTPELRFSVEDHHLLPFNKRLTKEQLEKQKPDAVPRAPEIYETSYGHPLGNYLLAARPTVIEAMEETVDGLLDGVPAEERSWIEALCTLQTFDEERLPALLAAYLNDSSILKWPYKEVRQTRDRLLRTALVRWREDAGGWEVDQAIRPVLEKYLQQTKPDVWQRLHCAAYRLYEDWQQQYPDERQRWQVEANYHAQCLHLAGHDPDQCL